MNSSKNNLLLLAVFLFLLGCSNPITAPPQAEYGAPKKIVDSNLKIGDEATIIVGNPVLRVKEYSVVSVKSQAMTPSVPFSMSGGGATYTFNGEGLKIIGETVVDKEVFIVLDNPGWSTKLLVNKSTNKLYNKVLNDLGTGNPSTMIWTFKTTPEQILFNRATTEHISSAHAYSNYEFIFSGKVGKTFNFLYREYTSNDLARPSFNQSVAYEEDGSDIMFKTMKFKILESNSSSLKVKIINY